MEELPPEIMDRILGYFEHNMCTIKLLRHVSKGFNNFVAPFLLSTIAVFSIPKVKPKCFVISKRPLLTYCVKKYCVPSLTYLKRANRATEDDNAQLLYETHDPSCTSVLVKVVLAWSTAAYKCKRTCVWNSSKLEGTGPSANPFDLPHDPVRGLPLELSLFLFLESFEIAHREWEWKMVEATTYGLGDP